MLQNPQRGPPAAAMPGPMNMRLLLLKGFARRPRWPALPVDNYH